MFVDSPRVANEETDSNNICKKVNSGSNISRRKVANMTHGILIEMIAIAFLT